MYSENGFKGLNWGLEEMTRKVLNEEERRLYL